MRILSLFILISLTASCYQVKRNCDNFKTGTFIWEQEIEGELLTTTFKRTENLQIETFKGVTDSSKVEWINDCEWRVIPINPKTNADSRAYLFKILTTTADSYTFEFKQSGNEVTYNGTAYKK